MLSAAIQLSAGPDHAANLAAGIAAVREAAGAGATLIVLPEKWVAYGDEAGVQAAARPLDEWAREFSALAAELGVDLVAGSVSERPVDGDRRLFNTSLHLAADGGSSTPYRKVHLFDADVEGRRYRESDAEQPGDALAVSALAASGFTLGQAICFDVRFPELFGRLADLGANVISLPSAFTERTTRDHWEVLVRARAIEAGAFVVAANQCGEHPDGSRTGGNSLIVSPWGEVLARAGGEQPEIIYAELDRSRVGQAREALPVRRLRRPELYRDPGEGSRPALPRVKTDAAG